MNQLKLEILTYGYTAYKALRAPFVGNTSQPSIQELKAGLQGILDARKKIHEEEMRKKGKK
ncbi:MAG: hypothetical protein HQM10_20180 [Candidatus Riflebacteria bacterium]|nr:hypothetical protein [Candidatus Riflebacteria bacterium]